MKFLCVPCDSPMKLQAVGPPEGGSLSVVYACPECGYEMAMLTNPYETQVVQSLGVRIGPDRRSARRGGNRRPTSGSRLSVRSDDAGQGGRVRGDTQRPASRSRCGGPPPPKRGSPTSRRSCGPWRGPASSDSPGSGGSPKWTRRILDAARDFFGM